MNSDFRPAALYSLRILTVRTRCTQRQHTSVNVSHFAKVPTNNDPFGIQKSGLKVKVKWIYIVASRETSGMDHTVLPAITPMPAFTS